MKIINNSKNTIYLEDIDEHIPYEDGKPIFISSEKLKKSRSLRNVILTHLVEVVEYDKNERIETSLMYLLNKMHSAKSEEVASADTSENIPETVYEVPLPKTDSTAEIKIHGLFYDASGYAKVNKNLAKKLKYMGYKIKIDPKRSQNQLNSDELKDFVEMEKTKISRNHILIDSIIPSFGEVGTGRYKILYTTIESYTIPQQFLDSCQNYDEIWLTSFWSADILKKYVKDKPIHTVVTGVDPELYYEGGDKFNFKPGVKDFVFLSVFAWNYRKGWDVLCKAYFDEFSAEDNVSLLIMSRYQSGKTKHHREKIKSDIDELMKQFPNKDMPHLVRYGQMVPEKDMPKLYRAADAFVLPSRGEGGGLPPLEAAMCGLPVIMTNCSGQQMYLREDNSYMIEIDRLAEVQHGQMNIHYWDGQKFPSLTSVEVHNQLRRAMRRVYENKAEAREKNQNMQRLIMKEFTWNNTAKAASERIDEIWKQLKG